MTSLSDDGVYKELLERLEIKIVNMKEVRKNVDLRIEAEFFNAKRAIFNSVKGIDIETFSQYGTSKALNDDRRGYPVLRLNEFDTFFIHEPVKYCDLINEETYESLKLKENDVLICRTNGNPKYVGKAALVPKDYDYAFASYLYRIRPDAAIINAATLVAYLNSSYGRIEIERLSMVGNQTNFSPAKFRQIEIPVFGKELLKAISNTVKSAFINLNFARDKYTDAEFFLTRELSLDTWHPSHEQISMRSYKDIMKRDRIDAEYYQPKYDEIANEIKKIGSGCVATECNIYDKNFNPEKETEYKYIELSNIGASGEITGCTVSTGAELPTRARRIVHTGDIIISSIEGSLQSCALITDEFDDALCSTGFYVLDSDKINSETLLVLFKSQPIQALLKQQCSGTILTAFSKGGLLAIPMPYIRDELQSTIKKSIQKSFDLRHHSTKLLEAAKRAVEIAIEQDEKTATEYLSHVI